MFSPAEVTGFGLQDEIEGRPGALSYARFAAIVATGMRT